MLPQTFTATLKKCPHHGGWTYVIWPQSAEFFGTHGLVKVGGTVDGVPFKASFTVMGDGNHLLPFKVETRKIIGKEAGDQVTVTLIERY